MQHTVFGTLKWEYLNTFFRPYGQLLQKWAMQHDGSRSGVVLSCSVPKDPVPGCHRQNASETTAGNTSSHSSSYDPVRISLMWFKANGTACTYYLTTFHFQNRATLGNVDTSMILKAGHRIKASEFHILVYIRSHELTKYRYSLTFQGFIGYNTPDSGEKKTVKWEEMLQQPCQTYLIYTLVTQWWMSSTTHHCYLLHPPLSVC